MKSITQKGEIKLVIDKCLNAYHSKDLGDCLEKVRNELLSKKVKFPLLEYAAHELYTGFKPQDRIRATDIIQSWKTEGGNVLTGIFLQNRLSVDFDEVIEQTEKLMKQAEIWYTCDIIGERVFGVALLKFPEKTLPIYRQLSKHDSHWVVRPLGSGAHYAIKKGLSKKETEKVFKILLSIASRKHKEIKQGIGWAAKTTAKFHPDIISRYRDEIDDEDKVAGWFRTKVRIGLEMNAHAKGN